MKILILSEYLHPQTSGISVRIEYYIKYLREGNHVVTVYGPTKCPTANRKLWSVPFHPINSDMRLCLPSIQLYKDIAFGNYDMVHIVGPNILLCTILIFLLCKLLGITVCTSYHTNSLDFFKEYVKNPLAQKLASWWGIYCHYYPTIWLKIPILHPENYTDLIIGCNNYNKGYILSTGVDTNLFQYSTAYVKKRLVYIGRVAPEKNLLRLLHLFSKVQNEYTLDIVGFGPSEDELKQYVRQNQIQNVQFIGFIWYKDLCQYYQRGQAFICTSLKESYGFTLLEAMSCGTPIIYPKCDVFDKLYKSDFPHLEYHIDHEEEFLKALDYVEAHSEQLRQSCRHYAEKFSWKEATNDLITIYQTIINRNVNNRRKTD